MTGIGGKMQYRSVILRPRVDQYGNRSYHGHGYHVAREGGYGPYAVEWCVYTPHSGLLPVARRRTLKECAAYVSECLEAA